jgi:tetratricopeptide (TPR) repeat protein
VIAGLAVAAMILALVGGAPGLISREWSKFKSPVGPSSNSSAERFASASGNGRYQYWSAALDAFESRPLTGIGPGTYEFWWAEHGSIPGFVRNAHSLYLETLGELGLPGLALLLALLGTVFVSGARGLRRADASERAMLAAALAAAAGFVSAAAIDWVWQVTVVPVAFLLLTAAVLRTSGGGEVGGVAGRVGSQRTALAAVSVCALVAIGVPMLAINDVRQSQEEVRAGHLDSALSDADSAAGLTSFAATPNLQRALVFEAQGNLGSAVDAATQAVHQEPTNWRTWLTLSRIDWEDGRAKPAVAAYRKARSLNPHSPLFLPGGAE